MGVGRTVGLDGAHVDGPGRGSERRQMVQPDRQGDRAGEPGGGLDAKVPGQRRRGGSGSPDGGDVRAKPGSATWRSWRDGAAGGHAIGRRRCGGCGSPSRAAQEKRPLGIPTVRDRVVQAALRHVLEPIFERDFAEHSYGFRPGRGCKDALRRVDAVAQGRATRAIVDADLKSYFDTIPHDELLARGARARSPTAACWR